MSEEQTTMEEIKKLIEGGAEIPTRTRDILLFSAIIETNKQLAALQAAIRPLVTFYKAAIWASGIAIASLITMAMSGKLEIIIK